MIQCSHFIFVHMPKTGGSFVAECFKSINHNRSNRYNFFKRLGGKQNDCFTKMPGPSKHARVADIPESLRKLPVVGCIRDPLEWYRSNYCFAWWRRYPERYPGVFECEAFPHITFAKYLELSNSKWIKNDLVGAAAPSNAGRFTVLLLNWFSPDPINFFRKCGSKINVDDLISEIGHIHWLRIHRLNDDLYTLLLNHGFSPQDIGFILDAQPKLPTKDPRVEEPGSAPIECDIDAECRSIIQSKDAAAFQFMQYIESTRNG